jgi:LacI family transcriptional regulator
MRPTPHHRKIYQVLRERIVMNVYPAESKLPTEDNLTREFNVSRITIMHALRDLVADGFIWRKQGLGSFVRKSTEAGIRLGLVIPGMAQAGQDSVYPGLQLHLVRQASRQGWQVLLGDAEFPSEVDAAAKAPVEVARRLVAHGVTAVIYVPLPVTDRWIALNHNVLAEFKNANVSVVLLGRDIVNYPERSQNDLVCTDEVHAGFCLGTHLASRKARRMLFVSGVIRYSNRALRLTGLRQAFECSGRPPVLEFLWQENSEDKKLMKLLKGKQGCDAIVCENDRLAALVMRSLLSAGIQIPKQIKLASFDDAPMAELLPIPLTSFAQPALSLADEVISAVKERSLNPALPPRLIQLQGRLVVRKST